MHFIGSSCTTFSSSASFFPGERVGTMQLGSPGGQGLPCRLPRCLFLAYINRRLHTFVASRRRGRGRRLAIATVLHEYRASGIQHLDRVRSSLHLHAHSCLVYVRRDIILAKSKHLRDFLRESSSGSAIERERGRNALAFGQNLERGEW